MNLLDRIALCSRQRFWRLETKWHTKKTKIMSESSFLFQRELNSWPIPRSSWSTKTLNILTVKVPRKRTPLERVTDDTTIRALKGRQTLLFLFPFKHWLSTLEKKFIRRNSNCSGLQVAQLFALVASKTTLFYDSNNILIHWKPKKPVRADDYMFWTNCTWC